MKAGGCQNLHLTLKEYMVMAKIPVIHCLQNNGLKIRFGKCHRW